MSSVNKSIIIGNVGKDPEIRETKSGTKIASFSLATSERWTDKQSGEKKEITDWHNVVVFNTHLVPVVEKFVRKGSKLYIEGSMKTRKWQDKNGVDRYTTEVVLAAFGGSLVLLDRQESNRPPPADPESYGSRSQSSNSKSQKPASQDEPPEHGGNFDQHYDQDIPF